MLKKENLGIELEEVEIDDDDLGFTIVGEGNNLGLGEDFSEERKFGFNVTENVRKDLVATKKQIKQELGTTKAEIQQELGTTKEQLHREVAEKIDSTKEEIHADIDKKLGTTKEEISAQVEAQVAETVDKALKPLIEKLDNSENNLYIDIDAKTEEYEAAVLEQKIAKIAPAKEEIAPTKKEKKSKFKQISSIMELTLILIIIVVGFILLCLLWCMLKPESFIWVETYLSAHSNILTDVLHKFMEFIRSLAEGALLIKETKTIITTYK